MFAIKFKPDVRRLEEIVNVQKIPKIKIDFSKLEKFLNRVLNCLFQLTRKPHALRAYGLYSIS